MAAMSAVAYLCAWLGVCLLPFAVSAQEARVAITIDDLPYADGGMAWSSLAQQQAAAENANRKLLAGLRRHHAPVTGFVIQKRVEALSLPTGTKILKWWIASGFDLGNHTYSHGDANTMSTEEIEREIVQGETTIGPLMKGAGKGLAFFRFPMNHTGDTREKHDAIAAFLARRGYRLAACTIDASDYVFNAAYVAMLAKKDAASARKLRDAYLAYTGAEIDYYAGLNQQALGYAPPGVMLLHDNRLNADVIDELLRIFESKRYRFVSLDEAETDGAYQIPETYFTKFGPMWGYRWAAEKRIRVNGALESEPPQWVVDYGKTGGK